MIIFSQKKKNININIKIFLFFLSVNYQYIDYISIYLPIYQFLLRNY